MRAKIFDELDRIAPLIPTPLYWLDTNFIYVGANEPSLEAVQSFGLADKIIGKSFYDCLPRELAKELVATTKVVIETGKRITVEEHGFDANDKERYFETVKSPLFDDKNNLVGVLCTAVEVTDRKEKDKIRFEQQEQFRKISAQVAHDIGSPLAALQMVIPHCDTLEENTRNVLNKSATRIADIAKNFLSQFKPEEDKTQTKTIKEPTLISAEILEVLTEKKYQYSKYSIEFVSNISQAGAFAFINVDSRSFKRMLSNLINNAVEAIEGKSGKVTVSVESLNNQVELTVADNGKGMPEDVKDNLLNNIQITAGKTEGHGIGYTQIRDTITQNNGSLYIKSEISKGTQITVTFPQNATPEWMAEKLNLQEDDLVVILDDDESIHDAWETRLENTAPHIKRNHFKDGRDAIEFINKLDEVAKRKVFLLTDYELLRQGLNGLDVIAQTEVTRSILVTSHHNNMEIRRSVKLTNTKVLPKPLASVISVNLLEINKLENVDVKVLPDNIEVKQTSIPDIKSQVGQEKPPIFRYLEIVAPLFPAPIYWFDLESRFVGLNQPSVEAIGGDADTDIIGKSVYEQGYPFEMADSIAKHNQKVIAAGKVLSQEDVIRNQKTGKIRYFTAIRGPLYNENGDIIGVLGTSVEITAEKEAERLKIENAAHVAHALEQQLKFREIAAQVAHDIGSPLAALQMVIPHCNALSENTRNVLSKSATRIADIAENFLSQFKSQEEQTHTKTIKQPTLISAEILEVLTEKKYQYSKYSIEFISNISQAGAFAFIDIDSRGFKRMLSNLINNAVEAIDDGKPGEVIVSLESINDQVELTIADNGKGMAEDIKNKILNNIQVTSGKTEGCGIGYTQIRDTITQNNGSLSIETKKGKGTKIIITFPQTATPEWMAEKLNLQENNLVVILDDDESIHDAWETRFEKSALNIKPNHFKNGRDAIRFINNRGKEAKHKVFLLTDYELLRQGLNGLDVIEQTGITNSVLVTSHHHNLDLRYKAKLTNTKILPKSLASLVPINFLASVNKLVPDVDNKRKPEKKEVILNGIRFTEETLKLIKYFESFSETVPAATYLLDIEFRVIGINSRGLNLISTTKDKLFGKTVYEFYPKEVADDLTAGFEQVVESGRELVTEHKVPDFHTGNYLYFEATLSPLYNDYGEIVGIIGASIEITAKKEVQQLFVESQHDFRKICTQVVHDLGSPVALLQQIIPQCDSLPAGTRSVINNSAMQIADIAEKFHAQFNLSGKQTQGGAILATKIIEINDDDLVIILSDDNAIRGIWETRFKQNSPVIKRLYFKHGSEAKVFLSQLDQEAKQRIFLLADYELLQHDLKFFDVIEQIGIKRSILITRHPNNPSIKYKAKLSNTKIFPKPLETDIEISLLNKDKQSDNINTDQQQVDLVILDDDAGLVDTLIMYMVPPDKKVDKYHKPHDVFNNLNIYSKQTKFLIDNQYEGEMLNGIGVAARLKEYGYTNLYLFTNEVLDRNQIPDYVKVIAKDNLQAITNLLNAAD